MHDSREFSDPVQLTSSRKMDPEPMPKEALLFARAPFVFWKGYEKEFQGVSMSGLSIYIPTGENPSWEQTTPASKSSQLSSHTVPHSSLIQISTRPSYSDEPPTSLTSPVLHTSPESFAVCMVEYIHWAEKVKNLF